MLGNDLPPDGELRLGSVVLPPGRRVLNFEGEPVAWGTSDSVTDPGDTWFALTEIRHETGLVPILMQSHRRAPGRPWDEREFDDPADLSSIGAFDPVGLLAKQWDDHMPSEDEWTDSDNPAVPFGREFPGLAPAESSEISDGELRRALDGLPPTRIALVPAHRPADVLACLGWFHASQFWEEPLALTSVLRSWEDRFGAFLFQVGYARISLLVRRPPRTGPEADRIAAEHYAFADEWGGFALSSVADISELLVNSPVWTFWWD